MKQDGTTRSRWPRILMYFLSAMLMLTLLSRAADSIMLPVVKCERPFPGALKHTTVLSGVIVAREQLPVMAVPEFAVAQVHVRAGQSVKAGDTLLSYDTDALEASLREAEHALKQQQTEREKAAGSATGAPDEGEVRSAEQSLARAGEDLKAKTEEQERAVRLAEADLKEAEAELKRTRKEGEIAFAEAYAKHLKEAQEAFEAVEKEVYEARVAMDWARNALTDRAKNKYKELQAVVDKAQTRSDTTQTALADAHLAAYRSRNDGDEKEAQRVVNDAQKKANAAAAALDQAQIRRDRIPGARDYTTKRRALELVQVKYDKARKELNYVERRADSVVRKVEQECEGVFSAAKTAEATLLEKKTALDSAKLTQDAALRSAERAQEDAETALQDKQRAFKELKLDVQLKDEAIAEKESEVAVLRRAVSDGGTVRAPVDGTITELIVKPGDTATGAALRLSPSSSGLVVRADVSEDQAKHLTPGMEARFQRSGDARASQYVAVLKSIAPTATGNEASFDLPDGAGAIGQAVTLTTTQNTETYPMVVPLGATVESGGIKGVYRVRIGQSVLGDMEYAEFVPVSIIEQDSQNAAIDASLSDQDQVIVSSSKPLNAGNRIRSSS